MNESDQVCLIDDDEAVRDSVGLLLENHEFQVSSFGSAEEFLNRDGGGPAAVLRGLGREDAGAVGPRPAARAWPSSRRRCPSS